MREREKKRQTLAVFQDLGSQGVLLVPCDRRAASRYLKYSILRTVDIYCCMRIAWRHSQCICIMLSSTRFTRGSCYSINIAGVDGVFA